jgi:hypothetical protein
MKTRCNEPARSAIGTRDSCRGKAQRQQFDQNNTAVRQKTLHVVEQNSGGNA